MTDQADMDEACALDGGSDVADVFPVPITMAFQPIVDAQSGLVFAQEALVRGAGDMGAGRVMAQVTPSNRSAFDQDSRRVAIHLAARLGLGAAGERALLSINFLPNAVGDPDRSLEPVLAAAEAAGLSPDRILFEFNEREPIDPAHLQAVLKAYQARGFMTAIDDFGAGHSGLTLLTRFQPDLLKLDMNLIRRIDVERVKRTMVAHIVAMATDLGAEIAAEGVETAGEFEVLRDLGVSLLQGYLFARPAFESFAKLTWPEAGPRRRRAA